MRRSEILGVRIIGILVAMCSAFFAYGTTIKDDPYEVFDISKKMYDSAEVRILTVDDVSNRCQQESNKRGLGGFPYKVYACTFWNDGGSKRCTIVLPKRTNMHQLGHEIRHCFLGAFHP